MYASQISGNRWDGSRFSNTDGTGTPLTYKHLLTQLTFKAMKKVTGGLSVKVKKITVTVTNSVTLALTNGETSFSGSGELSLELPTGNFVCFISFVFYTCCFYFLRLFNQIQIVVLYHRNPSGYSNRRDTQFLVTYIQGTIRMPSNWE